MERLLTSDDVLKKQWHHTCISTHVSCHAMNKNQLLITSNLLSLIKTSLRLFQGYYDYNRLSTRLILQSMITIVRKRSVYSSNRDFYYRHVISE